MERTVPRSGSEEIELYLRTVYSLMRSTTEIQIRSFEELQAGTNSSLHLHARSEAPDASAFIYSFLRLPSCMPDVRTVLLGQSIPVFAHHGFTEIESWQKVSARARRRRCFFNRRDTLACLIASRSDIDDVIPNLTAYQIEWNKINLLLQNCPPDLIHLAAQRDPGAFSRLAEKIKIAEEDLHRIWVVMGADFEAHFRQIAGQRCNFRVRLLNGSLSEYWRATRAWWENIERSCPDLLKRPVYFISSNTHSTVNLLSGFAFRKQDTLADYLERDADADLQEEWGSIKNRAVPSNKGNLFYYVLKKLEQTPEGEALVKEQIAHELACGIRRIPSDHSFEVDAQVIELARLKPDQLDARLQNGDLSALAHSDALILNIDYPLGLAAYNILTKVAEHCEPVLGVYVMGKAATLNGVFGDVMIPNVVHDEHSQNTYLFQNAFNAVDVAPYLVYGTVLDNQKAVSVLGTFLQNARIMDVFYREGYTDIEMEAGPYLSAIYEMSRPKRHPVNEIINLYGVPFDVGILHYVSDTPMSKGKNLGAGALSYFGMDSTYATSLAILRRIFELECKRLQRCT